MNLSHSFSIDIATKYDVNTALLLQHFTFWYQKNKADNHQLFEGEYWVRMKLDTLTDYFPYLTKDQLRYGLKKMLNNNLLKKSEFNYKKNDRTKWYTLTKYAKSILEIESKKVVYKTDKLVEDNLKILTGKTPSNRSGKIPILTDKIPTSIYKEEDIEYRYNYIIEKLRKNKNLIELLAMQNKLSKTVVEDLILEFTLFCQSVSQPEHNNDKDLFVHFSSWLRKQDLKEFKYEKELEWFIGKFNKISTRDFVITDTIRKLFVIQISNGFSSKQMATAIKNLYSSNIKNSFHLKHHFKFATPEYLLADKNLNKYLNVKY